MSLEDYRKKRNFSTTGEPKGQATERGSDTLIFVVQKHDASRLHYDFRLEIDGVLKSWAVPKGPSAVPADKRLAVPTEDHPIEYSDFEGEIPEGQYGAGTVEIWDRGSYETVADTEGEEPVSPEASLRRGRITMRLCGEKMKGEWALVRMKGKKEWLLIKKKDEHADVRSSSAPTHDSRNT